MLKFFCLTINLILCTSAIASNNEKTAPKNKGLANCHSTGVSAKCGNATEIVVCNGNKRFFIADDQKVKNMQLDLLGINSDDCKKLGGIPSNNRENLKCSGVLSLKNKEATVHGMSVALNWYGKKTIKGEAIKISEANKDVSDSWQIIEKEFRSFLPKIQNMGVTGISVGKFDAGSEAKLFDEPQCSQSIQYKAPFGGTR